MQFQAPESLSEQIAQHLGQRIVTGQLKAGERIQELRVAGELDVSRGSVREALLILERRYLIKIYPRRGATVSELTPDLVNSLYDIYTELLAMLVRRLIDKALQPELATMVNRIRELDQLLDTEDDTAERIIEHGFTIMGMACDIIQNPFLEETLENFKPAISRTYYLALANFREERAQTRAFFRNLGQAAATSDSQQAEQTIIRFGEHQRSLVLQTLAAQHDTTGSQAE